MRRLTLSGTAKPDSDQVLLISGCNPGAGGLFVLDNGVISMIDRLTTHGLAVSDGHLYRVMACLEHTRPASDLLVYDRYGVFRFDRLDGVGDAHDVLPRGAGVAISSSAENAVYSIGADGKRSVLWRAQAPEDAWHVNGLLDVDGQLYATAFGMFDRYRAWSREPGAPTGVLVRLPSEEVVLGGLTQPHSPRRIDGAWVVCNSSLNEVAAYDERGTVLQRRHFDGYTRGMTFDERYLYVGESGSRHINQGASSSSRITILERSDWSLVDSFVVDAAEIYDVVLVPGELAEGAEIGFRTNATRVEQQDQLAMFAAAGVTPRRLWAIGEPLPADSLRAVFEAELPARIAPNDVFVLPCRVTNAGDAILVSTPPNPVQFCYRWFDASGAPVGAGEWIHTPLPRALPPGETVESAMRIAAPHAPGDYTLAVTLLQEGVAWFDDITPAAGVRGTVVVTH